MIKMNKLLKIIDKIIYGLITLAMVLAIILLASGFTYKIVVLPLVIIILLFLITLTVYNLIDMFRK